MVRDDLEASAQAYQFALLLLAREPASEKERAEAVAAAEQLRSDVEDRYQRGKQDARHPPRALTAVDKLRADLEQKLSEAKRHL